MSYILQITFHQIHINYYIIIDSHPILRNMYCFYHPYLIGDCPRGVMVKAMDCGIVEREFVLQSRYYVHIRANTLGKGMNRLILHAMG